VESIAARMAREHRELDELLGRFLGAAHAGAADAARSAIGDFDDALRRHTAFEEEKVLPPPAAPGLAPAEEESAPDRLFRELRLEHVQIRELSGMMRGLVESSGDVVGALRLFPNLARRWDSHTEKEEAAFSRSAPGG
jgi:hypothetical protein